MEKKSVNRYCFALAESHLAVDKTIPAELGKIQIFAYQSFQLLVVETPSKVAFSKLQSELATQLNLSLETLSQSIAERIYWKYAMAKADLSLAHALAWNNSKRVAMSLAIKDEPELLAAYKKVHEPENIWQQINDNMDTMGVKDMELYMKGYQVFLLMDVPLDFDLDKEGEKWGQLPREQEWQNYVARFQKTDPEGKIEEKWNVMSPVI